ncbi:MAG: DUF547 domain-containing protein [Microcystaceae cyanobacterium]
MILNFTQWNCLLQQYVNELGQVDYQRWKKDHPTELTQWLIQLSKLDLSLLDSDELLAFWLNLYNALTISQVLDYYPIPSIFPKVWGIPNLIAFLAFFKRPLWQNAGKHYSLNYIEHQILRKQFDDPRIHFALVCASVGCPLLRQEAYTPQQVQQQLSQDAYRFINNPQKVHYVLEENCLYLSPIFRWYRQDFAKVTKSLTEYLLLYLEVSLPSSFSCRYLSYDWSLNQRIS